jgi:hypothetical protein
MVAVEQFDPAPRQGIALCTRTAQKRQICHLWLLFCFGKVIENTAPLSSAAKRSNVRQDVSSQIMVVWTDSKLQS